VVCRTARTKQELIRVVRRPDGGIEIDESGRLAGRGAYLCREGDCRDNATRRGGLARALRTPIPPGLLEALAGDVTTTNEGGARGQE
jgi:uncharacterized protein